MGVGGHYGTETFHFEGEETGRHYESCPDGSEGGKGEGEERLLVFSFFTLKISGEVERPPEATAAGGEEGENETIARLNLHLLFIPHLLCLEIK